MVLYTYLQWCFIHIYNGAIYIIIYNSGRTPTYMYNGAHTPNGAIYIIIYNSAHTSTYMNNGAHTPCYCKKNQIMEIRKLIQLKNII